MHMVRQSQQSVQLIGPVKKESIFLSGFRLENLIQIIGYTYVKEIIFVISVYLENFV